MYKKAFARRLRDNKFLVHLWEDSGYTKVEWDNQAYIECNESEATCKGLNGESLKKIKNYRSDNPKLHFHDMPPYQKFLIEKYGKHTKRYKLQICLNHVLLLKKQMKLYLKEL